MKTSLFLTLLPFVTVVVSGARLRPLIMGLPLPSNPLQARQGVCPSGTSLCDGTACAPVCCNWGNAESCILGDYCVITNTGARGCCEIGDDCSDDEQPTCLSHSVPGCELNKYIDCCPQKQPYCILTDHEATMCSTEPGKVADRKITDPIVGQGYYYDDEDSTPTTPPATDDSEIEDDDIVPSTPTKKPSSGGGTTVDDSEVEDEIVPTPTKKPSSGGGAAAEETPESGSDAILDKIKSKASDLAEAAATSAINKAVNGESEATGESSAARQVVGMGAVMGLGAVLGGMVLM